MRLHNLEEGLNETKVCKVCGDKMHNPTTDCDHDCHDEHGDHWITEGQYDWYARDYVKSMAPERMAGLDPIAKNAFLVDLEKTYPGIKKELGEGTWAWPDQAWQVKELDKILKSPIQAAKAADVLYNIIGDDELYDEIDSAIKRDPQSDVRPVVIRRLKNMGLIESNEELTEWNWKNWKKWFKTGGKDAIGSKVDRSRDAHTVDMPVGNLQKWLKEDPEAEAKVDTLTQMQDAYKYNEDRNAHSENILMLAHSFATRGEIKAIEGLLKITKQQGYVTPEQSEIMYNSIHKKYIGELFPIEESKKRMHISPDIAKAHTLKHTFSPIDKEKYEPRDGLEGPIMTKAGKVLYYDNVEGAYLDPDTDIYLSHEEWKNLSESEYIDHFDSMAAEIQKEGILHYSDAKGTPKYSEGYKAAKDGVKYDENPYSGAEKLQWSRGHNDERADRLTAAGEPNYGARGQFESK